MIPEKNHPWRSGTRTPPADGVEQIHSILAAIGYHRYRLNISQPQMSEILTIKFKKNAVGSLNTEQLKTFLAQIEKAQSIEELQCLDG